LPGPPPDLAISVNVDKPQVNVGEYAIFVVTVTNRAAQPAFAVTVRESTVLIPTSPSKPSAATGRGATIGSARLIGGTIPRIEPGATYSMSRTMRVRKPVTVPYFARVEGVNGISEPQIPLWIATTQVTGVQVTSDIAPVVIADRTNVKKRRPGELCHHRAQRVGVAGRIPHRARCCPVGGVPGARPGARWLRLLL
jgi:uncharacterized repeat protein (TIGR01451 family)